MSKSGRAAYRAEFEPMNLTPEDLEEVLGLRDYLIAGDFINEDD